MRAAEDSFLNQSERLPAAREEQIPERVGADDLRDCVDGEERDRREDPLGATHLAPAPLALRLGGSNLLLLGRRDSGPKIVEFDTVEHRGCFGDLAVVHFKEPEIGVGIGLAVARRSPGVKEDDHNVSVGA